MIEIVETPVDDAMSGTLWLFPCAVRLSSSIWAPLLLIV